MFNSRNKLRRHHHDAPTPRVRRSHSRRLSIEAMESRLLLSGNQGSGNDLDYAIWNLDSFQNNYAIISQGDSPAPVSTDSSSATTPDSAVSIVSDLLSIPSGYITTLPASPFETIPAYHNTNVTNGAGYTVSQDRGDFGVSRGYLYENLGWSLSDVNSFLGKSVLVEAPSNGMNILPVWSAGYTGTGVYVVVSDDGHDSLQLGLADLDHSTLFAGTSAAAPLVSGVTSLMLEANPNLNFRDVQEILVRSARTASETAHGVVDAEVAVRLARSWSNSLSIANLGYDIYNHSWIAGDVGQVPTVSVVAASDIAIGVPTQIISFQVAGEVARPEASNLPVAGQPTPVFINSATLAMRADRSADADSGAQTNGAASGLSHRPGLIQSTGKSTSDENLAEAVADLLSQDVIFAANSPQTNAAGGGIGVAADSTQPNADVPAAGTVVVATIEGSSDGGMVSIGDIVKAASDLPNASAGDQIASAENPAPIAGELTRVAVMELMEGEPEPAAPHAAADHVTLLAASGTADAEQSVGHDRHSAVQRAAKMLAEQAGVVTAMIAPVNPAYLATIANAAGDAFMAVVATAPAPRSGDATSETAAVAEAARSEAFSLWGNGESDGSQAVAANSSYRWLGATPILVALACERIVAAKKKRQRQEQVCPPAKASSPTTDAC